MAFPDNLLGIHPLGHRRGIRRLLGTLAGIILAATTGSLYSTSTFMEGSGSALFHWGCLPYLQLGPCLPQF
eukprot:5878410-Prorocentrum_lima.AAC.1